MTDEIKLDSELSPEEQVDLEKQKQHFLNPKRHPEETQQQYKQRRQTANKIVALQCKYGTGAFALFKQAIKQHKERVSHG